MIAVDNQSIYGWEAAVRGMRNPMNSWDKSDSGYKPVGFPPCYDIRIEFVVGDNDFDLMKRLVAAGTDHSKFMRFVTLTCDITAPFYWWKEYDTYKVGTVANSCSTMHKLTAKPFELSDFSDEHLCAAGRNVLGKVIEALNINREAYVTEGSPFYHSKDLWYEMVQLLPTSYNQKRTVQLNYQVLRNIYHSRKNHKLFEWVEFCGWIETLPYSELITMRSGE